MTEGLGATLAGVTSFKNRDLEDEEGPARRLKNWKSRWVWLEPRGSHAGGEGASHTALAGCWEFAFPSKGLCRSWGLIMGETGQPRVWWSTERFSPAAWCGRLYAHHNLWGRIVLICTLQIRNLRPRPDEVTPQGKGVELGLCRPLSHPGVGSEQVCPAGGSTPTVLAS